MDKINSYGYFLKKSNEPLVKENFVIDSVADDQVVVEVAGCGVCHTDITFYTGQVTTKQESPLVLGHEISGTVVATGNAFSHLQGKKVIVPAVLPCGECELCESGRDNICQHQKMPGNDFNGGFAKHTVVPGKFLCVLPDSLGKHKLSDLSVVADAITTPYQSLIRSGLKKDELAVVVGVGGIGIYMVQHAKNVGAKVIALDIDSDKLEVAKTMGADYVLSTKDMSERDVKKAVRTLVKENQLPQYFWKVFEMSGTASGQMTAFSLLSFAGSIGIVGFTMEKVQARLSNLMAFDADLFGNWGCRPEYYGKVVEDILEGNLKLKENVEEHSLDKINEVFQMAMSHKLKKRAILVP